MFPIVIIYVLLHYLYVYSFYKIIFMIKERERESIGRKKNIGYCEFYNMGIRDILGNSPNVK